MQGTLTIFVNTLTTTWHGFGGETKGAVVGAAATLLAAIFGFGALFMQLGSQGRQSREAIAEAERRKLKAEMFGEAVVVSRALADAAIDLSTKLRRMSQDLGLAAAVSSVRLGFPIPTTRFPQLMTAYSDFSDAALRFIFLVENRRVVDPRIIIFRTALNVVLHDTQKLLHSDFVLHVMPLLPVDQPNGETFPYEAPSVAAAEVVQALGNRFIDSLDDAIAYTEDFMVELQNRLLGDLFETQVPHREPIDPARRVVTLDDADKLETWFRDTTEWGRSMATVEADTKARFAN